MRLGAVHGQVGVLQQRRAVTAVLGRKADSDAARRVDGAAGKPEVAPQLAEELLHERIDVRLIRQPAQHQDELIPAEARDHILVANRRLQASRDLHEQLVADVVAQGVVDVLEAVQVDQQDGQGLARLQRCVQHVLELGAQAEPVLQPRERIVIREERDALLGALADADVLDHRPDVPRALGGVHDDAGDLHRHPRAVLALQAHLHRPEAAVVQQGLDPQRPLGVRLTDMPVRPSEGEQLFLRVPGDHLHCAVRLQKASVQVVERNAQRRQVVEAAKIRFADAQLLLRALAGGDVGDVSVPDRAAVLEPARHGIALHPGQLAARAHDAVLQVPGLESLLRSVHRLRDRLAVVLVGNPAQHGSVVHERLRNESVDAVSPGADVEEFAPALHRLAPLEDHSRHVVRDQRQPLAGEAALLIGKFLLGDVELHAVHAQRLAIGTALEDSSGAEHPAPLAVLAEQPMMAAKQLGAPLHDIGDGAVALLPIIRVTQLAQPLDAVDALIRRVAQRREEHGVGFDQVRRCVPFPGADVAALDHHLRTALVAARRLALAHFTGDVGLDAHPSLELAIGVAQRTRVGVQPPLAAILAAHLNLETDAALGGERATHAANRLRIRVVEKQQLARPAARRLRGGEARHLGEAVVDPDDAALRVVEGHPVAGGLGDQGHPLGGGLAGDVEHRARRLGAPAPPGPRERTQEQDSQQRIDVVA